MGINVYTDYKS